MAKTKKTETALTLEQKLEQTLVADWEQPYKVPANWSWCKLPALCEYIKAGGDKPKVFSDEKTSALTVPVVANGISNDGIVGFTSEAVEKAGSITVSGRGTIGFSVIRDYPYYPIVRLIVIRPNRTVLAKYIKFAFDHFIEQGTGTSIPQLTVPMLKDKFIPVPPLAEQQRIVDRIERMFSKLDEVKENVQNVIDGFDNRKSAILHKAFNGELTAKWRKENKANIADWESLTLNDVGEYKKGPFGSSITKAMFVPKSKNTYKVYEQGNAIRKTLEYGQYYISKEKYEELKGFAVKSGDIIISCAGTIGEVYKLPDNCEPGIINQALMRVRLFENIEEEFFINYFGEILKWDINNKSKGTAIKNIPPFKVMKAMPIQLPSLSEQREIVRILNEIMFKEQRAKEKAGEVLERIELIKKSVLARAFRGELGTNNPDEESSIELLKTVLYEAKNDTSSTKLKSKRVSIPEEIKAMLSNYLEKDILKLFYKAEADEVSIDDIMSVSSNKFEIMDALKALEEKKLISKKANGIYKLAR